MSEIKIKYYISDGYVGKDRPHYLKVDSEEWEKMNDDEKDRYVTEYAIENISVDWTVAS